MLSRASSKGSKPPRRSVELCGFPPLQIWIFGCRGMGQHQCRALSRSEGSLSCCKRVLTCSSKG
uniref:Uncharacterized protein n=1 Tax=Arundo donax TaxID=35708 RepID=A0A0A9FUR5_ARUDO